MVVHAQVDDLDILEGDHYIVNEADLREELSDGTRDFAIPMSQDPYIGMDKDGDGYGKISRPPSDTLKRRVNHMTSFLMNHIFMSHTSNRAIRLMSGPPLDAQVFIKACP